MFFVFLSCIFPPLAVAHQPITTKITWNKELVRIFRKSCTGCHRQGGSAFSLGTYKEARAWARAIRDEVLEKRMPPWPAAKGFGDFRNDRSLTPWEIEMIVSWAEGGVPRGDPKDLPKDALLEAPKEERALQPGEKTLAVERVLVLKQNARALAVRPLAVEGASVEVRALRPDGSRETLVWIRAFQTQYRFTYWFRAPVWLPRGTRLEVRGPEGARAELVIVPATGASGTQRPAARR